MRQSNTGLEDEGVQGDSSPGHHAGRWVRHSRVGQAAFEACRLCGTVVPIAVIDHSRSPHTEPDKSFSLAFEVVSVWLCHQGKRSSGGVG